MARSRLSALPVPLEINSGDAGVDPCDASGMLALITRAISAAGPIAAAASSPAGRIGLSAGDGPIRNEDAAGCDNEPWLPSGASLSRLAVSSTTPRPRMRAATAPCALRPAGSSRRAAREGATGLSEVRTVGGEGGVRARVTVRSGRMYDLNRGRFLARQKNHWRLRNYSGDCLCLETFPIVKKQAEISGRSLR